MSTVPTYVCVLSAFVSWGFGLAIGLLARTACDRYMLLRTYSRANSVPTLPINAGERNEQPLRTSAEDHYEPAL